MIRLHCFTGVKKYVWNIGAMSAVWVNNGDVTVDGFDIQKAFLVNRIFKGGRWSDNFARGASHSLYMWEYSQIFFVR